MRHARRGAIGGVILALGRALGEIMAVTMVIGSDPQITTSLSRSAYSMAAVLTNEFAEANEGLHRGTLVGIALVLLARGLVGDIERDGRLGQVDRPWALGRHLYGDASGHRTDGLDSAFAGCVEAETGL